MIDSSLIPPIFANCKVIEFGPADPTLVRDYLRLITLSQGHILEPNLLERIYLESKRDLRQTLTRIQFWCQFGVGDKRSGAEWIDWGGREEDLVVSNGTYTDNVEWRQESASGEHQVLETVEETVPDLDIEGLFFPRQYQDQLTNSPMSMFKRQKSTFAALKSISDFLETMSFLDYTTDRQFTAYEVAPFLKPTIDDVLGKPILRNHPGQRFENPQGGENRLSPGIRVLARRVLDENIQLGGYQISSISNEKIIGQPLNDLLNPQPYVKVSNFLTTSFISRDSFCEVFEELLYVSTLDDKYLPTVGLIHSFATVVQDVAPYIRDIIRAENDRKATRSEQMSLDSLWNNIRKTRRQVKEEQEGRKRWFADKLNPEAVLKTGMDISCTESDDYTRDIDMEE
jgi:hypothetical protein